MEKLSLVTIKKKNYSDVYHFIYRNQNASKQAIAQGLVSSDKRTMVFGKILNMEHMILYPGGL